MPEPVSRWRRVSASGIDVYVPLNAPIDPTSRMFAFGQLESGEMAIAPGFKGEGAGNGNGGQNGDGGDDGGDGSVDGTTSGGGVHSTRVKTVLLTTESQHMRQN